MKNKILTFVLPVILVSLITLSVSAQTKTSNSAYTNKSSNVSKYKGEFSTWQQKVVTFNDKYSKNEDVQDDLKTIVADLSAYKKSISTYSSSKPATASDANDAVKAAKTQLTTDYNTAKAKVTPVKKTATTPSKTN